MPTFEGRVYDVDFVQKNGNIQFGVRGTNSTEAFVSDTYSHQAILSSALVINVPVVIEYDIGEGSTKQILGVQILSPEKHLGGSREIESELDLDLNGHATRAKLHAE